jgi:hypothetical protein
MALVINEAPGVPGGGRSWSSSASRASVTCSITEGYPAGAPVLREAVGAFRGTDVSREETLRWLWLACHAAGLVWDYASWDVLSGRQVRFARDAGALITLPIAYSIRAGIHLFAGEFAEAASMIAQAESVTEATGSSIAPYGALAPAVFRGQEAHAAHLIQTATDDAGRRGEGAGLSFAQWADAVLGNSLGRYEQALAAAQQASEDSPAVIFANWALVELVEAAVRAAVPERAAGAVQRLSDIARACGTDWALADPRPWAAVLAWPARRSSLSPRSRCRTRALPLTRTRSQLASRPNDPYLLDMPVR